MARLTEALELLNRCAQPRVIMTAGLRYAMRSIPSTPTKIGTLEDGAEMARFRVDM